MNFYLELLRWIVWGFGTVCFLTYLADWMIPGASDWIGSKIDLACVVILFFICAVGVLILGLFWWPIAFPVAYLIRSGLWRKVLGIDRWRNRPTRAEVTDEHADDY